MLTGKWGNTRMMAEHRRRAVVAVAVLLTVLLGLVVALGDADDTPEPEHAPEPRTETAG